MRVLILTPTALPFVTGNAVTAERWRRSLSKKGIGVEVLATQDIHALDLLRELRRIRPELIHVHHAFRAGTLLLNPRVMDVCSSLPLVISPGGTDINLDFEMDDRKEMITQIYQMARLIISQSRETSKRLKEVLPDLRDRIAFVPKSFFWFGHDAFDLRKTAACRPENILFFMPAGIRPVKGNLECLTAFEKIRAARPRAKIVFAGPALDAEYANQFKKVLKRLDTFAYWVPFISPMFMRSAYQNSDIVLNASFSEGLSNALLEAVAIGKPVLASNIPGNWWPVLGDNGDQPAGYLFNPGDAEDFVIHALKLIDDEKGREVLGRSGRMRASRWPTPDDEAEGLIQVYQKAHRPF
jgi:L-malate glycosyltransferase